MEPCVFKKLTTLITRNNLYINENNYSTKFEFFFKKKRWNSNGYLLRNIMLKADIIDA